MNSDNENITFLKWWEGKRIRFNIILLVIFAVFLSFLYFKYSPDPRYINHWIKQSLSSFLIVNFIYSMFSIVSYFFNSSENELGNKKQSEFLKNKSFWRFLLFIQFVIAVLVIFIMVLGTPLPLIIPEGMYYY